MTVKQPKEWTLEKVDRVRRLQNEYLVTAGALESVVGALTLELELDEDDDGIEQALDDFDDAILAAVNRALQLGRSPSVLPCQGGEEGYCVSKPN